MVTQTKIKKIIAETMKLLGNSAYGKTITNIEKHTNISYCDEQSTQKLINDPRFKKLTQLTETTYEVVLAKSKSKWDLPIQIGYFVYQYAKLRMLEFHYDCFDKYLDRSKYQLCETDTDSLYLALSTDSFEEAVKPELKREFYQDYDKWFPALACDAHQEEFMNARCQNIMTWVPRQCCAERQIYDMRTPGLFKVENKGDGIVALCSKTYYCFGEVKDKFISKGLNKKLNQPYKAICKQVLDTGTSGGGKNRSLRTDGKRMLTYTKKRKALSYFYIKRKVQDDGVTTEPLDI